MPERIRVSAPLAKVDPTTAKIRSFWADGGRRGRSARLAALVTMGVYPDWGLLLFPFAVLALIVAGTAVGLLVTPIGLLYRDVGKGLPLLMQFLMYLSPVVFPMPPGGIAARVFEGNPMTPLIGAGRDWLTGGTTANVSTFILVNLAFLLLLLAVGIVYRLAMPILIERLGS